MERNRVGNSGLEVSSVTLGAFEFGRRVDGETASRLLEDYAEAGGTLVELPSFAGPAADVLGTAGIPDSVSVAARVGIVGSGENAHVNAGRATLLAQTRSLLQRLGRDRIDLLVLDGFDYDTPLDETAAAVDQLLRSGQVVHVAAAYLTGWQLATLRGAGIDVVAACNEHSLLAREVEQTVFPAADYLGVGILAGAGLGRGLLTGRYQGQSTAGTRKETSAADYVDELDTEASRAVISGVLKAASALGTSAVDVVMAWNRLQPQASTIVAPRTPEQLAEVIDSQLVLAPEILEALDQISDPVYRSSSSTSA
ncbi:aldo/keto reductase [Brevibacterium sp. 91QC2O2]|uniref:aldo/keto reductase n=1 Tax=Brevibacterium TaxID=1696 RepID=UPI00211CB5BB|nr:MULTISPECIES: aldo/keto reductase [unclassified Brevibacterium]MCQ9366787.1 aldo/keto reductase [Brevibacterium sp. 91QC2O2]MCQ9383937.1 aldo/keto reductase [Brevibacterium sp. 68QC2CO]